MAKNKNQDSVKHDFFRRLDRGSDIDLAASKAGVEPSKITEYLDEYRKIDSHDKLHHEAIQLAIHTLKEIASQGVEEDKIRCDAAKALLKFASDNLKNKVDKETNGKLEVSIASSSETLWDF